MSGPGPGQGQAGFYRVKVYKLNETGGWDDKGTGLASVGPLETPHQATTSLGLVVLAEDTHKTLLAHRICTDDDIYHRQDDTIITWTDVDVGTDVALSFQEANGCHAIWQHIARLQNDDGRPGRRRMVDEFESGAQPMDEYTDGAEGGMQGAIDLPPAEMGRLEEIAQTLAHVPLVQRDRVAQQLMAPGYLRVLLDLFKQAEDLEDTGSLTALFQAFRAAVLLNDTGLLEELLREEHVMDVMGALEYDPETTPGARVQHRKFLREAVVFKQVVPIESQETLAKIHQTYRIQYLKDVVLPRCLDDATYATLTSLMLFNNVDVLSALQADARFLPRLFGALKEAKPDTVDWADLVAFLQELCSLSKHLQMTQRQALWSKMQQLGLFDVLTKVVGTGSSAVKLRATDILLSTLGHDPLPLRDFLTRQPGHELLGLLVREMLGAPDDSGLPEQIAELLKLLVDPETMDNAPERSEFLEVFYDRYMDVLVASVSGEREIGSASAASAGARQRQQQQQGDGQQQQQAGGGGGGGEQQAGGGSYPASLLPPGPVPASTIGLIVDLLCYCVQHHQFRAKYHVLRKNVVEKVLKLLRRRERWLVVAGVRFLRTCIGTKDDFYMRYLVKNNLLEPLMTVFFENGARYNLLNSAVLELVEFVRKENVRELIAWLVQNFGDRFDEVDYVDTFKQVRIKYEQAMEKAGDAGAADGAGGPDAAAAAAAAAAGAGGAAGLRGRQRWRRDDREMDRDEEDYFSSDADADEDGGGGGGGGPAAAGGAGGGSPAAAAGPSGVGQQQQQQQQGGEGTSWLSTLAQYGEDEEGEDAARGQAGGGAQPPRNQQQQQQQQQGEGQQQPTEGQQQRSPLGKAASPQQQPSPVTRGSGGPEGSPVAAAAAEGDQQQQQQQQQQQLKRVSDGNGLSPEARSGTKRPKLQGEDGTIRAADVS